MYFVWGVGGPGGLQLPAVWPSAAPHQAQAERAVQAAAQQHRVPALVLRQDPPALGTQGPPRHGQRECLYILYTSVEAP